MNQALSPRRLRVLAILSALVVSGGAAAQYWSGWPALPINPWPGDRNYLGVLVGGCPASDLDPDNPPRARQVERIESPTGDPEEDRYVHEVRYWMVEPSNQVCPLPPPTELQYLIDLGPLPPGRHELRVTRFDDGVEGSVQTIGRHVAEGSYLPQDVTGAWYAPEQSGRGLFVAKRGVMVGVWWSTHDAHGQPTWVLMTGVQDGGETGGEIAGEAFTTTGPPLAPGPAQLETQRWGELSFRYRGCGRASLQWRADDPAIGEGQLDLVQLMLPNGIQPCTQAPGVGVQAIWEE